MWDEYPAVSDLELGLTSLFAISFLAVLSLFRNWLEAVLTIKQNRLDLGGQAVLKWCVECCWKRTIAVVTIK